MSDPATRYLPASVIGRPRQAAFVALAGSICLSLVSIAASQILLAGAAGGVLWLSARPGGRFPSFPRSVALPLALFFLWTVAAALASADIALGLTIVKKFYLFLIPFLVVMLFSGKGTILWTYRALFAVAVVAASAGLVQFALNPHRDALNRISGFMSQWMTYSGLLMLVLVPLVAYAFCLGWRKKWWAAPLCALLALAIYLSETRNAMIGTVAGVVVILLLLRRWSAIFLLAALLAAAYLLSPAGIQQRLRSSLDTNDPNTRNRIELFETSLRLIGDNPWFGVGPKNVSIEALRYRGSEDYPDWMYQHMHNNFLQIAAERGIPGLILWLWFVGALGAGGLAALAHAAGAADAGEGRFAGSAAVGSLAALLAAGMFEYNFGDSEVLILFLFIASAPFAWRLGIAEKDPLA